MFRTSIFKGTVPRDFRLQVFLRISFPQPLRIPIGPFRIFSKIRGDIRSSRCITNKKIWKVLIIFLEHLCVVEWTYRYIFMFTLRCQQFDIVPIFRHWYQQHQRYWWKNLPPVQCWYWWCTFTCKYLRKFSKNFEMTQMYFRGLGGRWFTKKPEAKNLVTLSL